MTDAPPLLRVEHLSMHFGGLVAIDDLSFDAARGEITAIIGPNGAGKTTVFNCLTGFYKPTVGRLTMQRDDTPWQLEQLEDYRIARDAGVARTFQNIRIFPQMSVLENLIVAQHHVLMKASGYSALALIGIGGYRKAEREAVALARYWLERVNLVERADEDAGSLSYGAQRRLEIARAMCMRPALLCLDEPAAGLNPRETGELNDLLGFIRAEHDIGLLLIEHDMGVVMGISDKVVVLDYGRKIADGTPEQVRNDPAVIRAYLGEEDDAAEFAGGRLMLSISGVHTFYGHIEALHGVDLEIKEGEIVTLIGANGAGKSTLLMTICGDPRAHSGQIVFQGRDITRLPTHEIMRCGIAHSPEGRRIFPRMTILENLQMGAITGNPDRFDQNLERVFGLFPILQERGGGSAAAHFPAGEQQMLAIARALMSEPTLLLLDEPSLGLAPLIVRQIFDVIRDINQSSGMTVFLVEQNAFHALRLADRGYVMVNGEISMTGSGKDLLNDPEVQRAYLEGGSRLMEALLGTSVGVFIGVTVVLSGFAAFMTGQALAATWRPVWQLWLYILMLGFADRFLTWALFQGELLSPTGYAIDTAVLLVIALLAFYLTRARQMAAQYPWLYERSGPFTWCERGRHVDD